MNYALFFSFFPAFKLGLCCCHHLEAFWVHGKHVDQWVGMLNFMQCCWFISEVWTMMQHVWVRWWEAVESLQRFTMEIWPQI